ncbi:hypothetical protein ACFSUS_27175 [Spirosoma soli]|uniref:DUF3592 domain-containing protein n=1 Tax=Spirosoma soli TaxID=1770529 RepID=A0ABW5MBF9_9BACT
MRYLSVYDLYALPPIDWRSLVLPFGLAIAAGLVGYQTRPGFARNAFFVFAALFVVLSVGIPVFNYYYLSTQKPRVVEGAVSDYWRKDWTTRRDGKNQHHSQEGFRVNTVTFWYNRSPTAGFTNVDPVEFPIRDGLAVRIHYVPMRQISDGERINAIVKLDVAEPR